MHRVRRSRTRWSCSEGWRTRPGCRSSASSSRTRSRRSTGSPSSARGLHARSQRESANRPDRLGHEMPPRRSRVATRSVPRHRRLVAHTPTACGRREAADGRPCMTDAQFDPIAPLAVELHDDAHRGEPCPSRAAACPMALTLAIELRMRLAGRGLTHGNGLGAAEPRGRVGAPPASRPGHAADSSRAIPALAWRAGHRGPGPVAPPGHHRRVDRARGAVDRGAARGLMASLR